MLNELIIKSMPLIPKAIIKSVAKKYISGATLADAINLSKNFESNGAMTTIDLLGEFVRTKEKALSETKEIINIAKAIDENKLKTYISVKLTSLGLGIDEDFAFENVENVVKYALERNQFIRLDMENSPFTDRTLNFYRKMRSNGLDNVGVVIQAYMRRSEDDLKHLKEFKPNVRLCKGIYRESERIAFKDKQEIRDNWKKLLVFLFENESYIGIATHDDELIDFAMNYIKKNNIDKDKYEFQMLLGVRENKRNEIIKLGHKMRIYTPYGEDWYGYSTRRLKENPDIAGHIFKAFFRIGK